MIEICRIAQCRLQVTHNGNNDASLSVTLFALFDGHQMINHLVDVATILGKVELASRVVVVVSHIYTLDSLTRAP